MALSLDGKKPSFAVSARRQETGSKDLTIYYSRQCPFILNCIREAEQYCRDNGIPLTIMEVDSPEKARTVPGVFNNYAAFYKVRFLTLQPLNEGGLKKVLAQIL
ncbi:MAG: hypothetical protein GXX04_00270 [Clostridiaceae bacterium]|nr:hypothetical protein [Clostridiaceae bacterium]